ncbi:MAG: RNA methyltransferase [Gemmataceae bacterium]
MSTQPISCYVLTVPGLEAIAAEEVTRRLGGQVKRTSRGLVVFRADTPDRRWFTLRTAEDLFLLVWGTDGLTGRREDLAHIRNWTAHHADWPRLLQIHHALRAPPRGRPSYRIVVQMHGRHDYRRIDAQTALAEGLTRVVPASWRYADSNASVEIWLTILGQKAVCGIRLTDRSMKHRPYKKEHIPASLRPAVAAALVQLIQPDHQGLFVDPMCGAGTILCEFLLEYPRGKALGGDKDLAALHAAAANLSWFGTGWLVRWDARRLPLPDSCVSWIGCNLPFGKQVGIEEQLVTFYRQVVAEWDRVLLYGARVALLAADLEASTRAAQEAQWHKHRQHKVVVLGQPAWITVWSKGRPA